MKKNEHKIIAIKGTQNNINILIGYNPEQKISDLLQDIKGSSSKWINKKGFVRGKFRGQAGYGASSYSRSQIDNVIKYIITQEHLHKKKTFHEEYIEFLEHYDISYDERFISKDIK